VITRRTFTDRYGVEWTVTESLPRDAAAETSRERRSEPRSQPRSRARSRRAVNLATRDLDLPSLQFESSRQRRRLAPIPPGWEQMPHDELEDLLGASTLIR